jgi:hypothetical protein
MSIATPALAYFPAIVVCIPCNLALLRSYY